MGFLKQIHKLEQGIAHYVIPLLIILGIAVFGTYNFVASHAATPSEPPQGLIIQVSTLAPSISPATLKTWLNQIRQDHRDPTKPGYINSVVLQDIADQHGTLLTSYLDVITPFLPGGATPAFSTAYIGTVDLPWTGTGSKYIDGIESASFRSTNVSMSSSVAQAFKSRYPKANFNWYITYEANLSGFWDTNIESSYGTYMNQLIPALSRAAPNKAFLWSPSFWTPYREEPSWALPSLKANFTDLFSKLKPSLTLNIQDYVGQSGGTSTDQDAATWINYLKQNWSSSLATVEVNTEQFKESPSGAITGGNPTEIVSRENYYVQQHISLGPAWEIRYWHQRVYGS